jgi:hypothetical protein
VTDEKIAHQPLGFNCEVTTHYVAILTSISTSDVTAKQDSCPLMSSIEPTFIPRAFCRGYRCYALSA